MTHLERRSELAILLTRISFFTILCFPTRGSSCTFYWDPYATSHGLFLSILIKVFGCSKVSKLFTRIASLVGVELIPVPHGDQVEDYHVLHIQAEKMTHNYVRNHYTEATYEGLSLYKILEIHPDCLDSLTLKELGLRLRMLVENVTVLNSITGDKDLLVAIERGAFPADVISALVKDHGFSVHYFRSLACLVEPLFLGLYLVYRFIGYATRLFHYCKPEVEFAIECQYPIVAVEMVDPDCVKGRSTEPNYLERNGWEPKNIIPYIRRSQRHLFHKTDHGENSPERRAIDVSRLPLTLKDLLIIARYYWGLMRLTFCGRRAVTLPRSNTSMREMINNLDLYVGLGALFRHYPIKGHLYNTLPNGRVAARYDSGIVTGICRKFGAKSITYQSRCYYINAIVHHFDAFDIFFMWGQKWIECYSYNQFVDRFQVSGNPGCDDLIRADNGANSDSKEVNGSESRKITLFTTDLYVPQFPHHYPWQYTKSFMLMVIAAASKIRDETTGAPLYELLLKTKHPEHVEVMLGDTDIAKLISETRVRVTPLIRTIHDVKSAILASDKVVTIGFSTPGMDALALGKMSIYFTPYQGIYNDIFDDKNISLVAHNEKELRDFILCKRPIDPDNLPQYLYRAGETVGPRLVEQIISVLE